MKRFASVTLTLTALTMLALPAMARGRQRMVQRLQQELGLTQQQVTQITPLFRQFHRQMRSAVRSFRASLTSDQLAALRQAHQTHQRPQLNLTEDQKAQLKALRQTRRSAVRTLRKDLSLYLTPDQMTKLQQLRRQYRQRRRAMRRQQQQQQR